MSIRTINLNGISRKDFRSVDARMNRLLDSLKLSGQMRHRERRPLSPAETEAVHVIVAKIEEAEAALEGPCAEPRTYSRLGNIYMMRGDLDDAVSLFHKGLKVDKRSAKLWANMALCLAMLNKFEKAHDCVERALDIKITYEDAWLAKGIISSLAGDHDEAHAAFQKVLTFNSDSVEARFGRAVLMANTNQQEKALELIGEVLELRPEDEQAMDLEFDLMYDLNVLGLARA